MHSQFFGSGVNAFDAEPVDQFLSVFDSRFGAVERQVHGYADDLKLLCLVIFRLQFPPCICSCSRQRPCRRCGSCIRPHCECTRRPRSRSRAAPQSGIRSRRRDRAMARHARHSPLFFCRPFQHISKVLTDFCKPRTLLLCLVA
jgi:hypothetical protein